MTALPSSIAELLSASEKNKAIEDTNKSLLDSLVSTVESLITEDNANTSTSNSKKDNTTTKVTDPVYVRFESNGGSSVEKQKIQKDTVAKEPSDPTKDGYTFYGWYVDKEFNGEEFDFENTKITETTTLYAKWEKYLAPRTALPEEEEEDDYDPDKEDVELSNKFFSAEYKAQLLDDTKEDSLFTTKFLKADFVDNIIVDSGKTLVSVLKDYINEGLSEMENNLKNNLYKESVEECYNYYLNAQYQSLLVARLKRMMATAHPSPRLKSRQSSTHKSQRTKRHLRAAILLTNPHSQARSTRLTIIPQTIRVTDLSSISSSNSVRRI